MTRAIMPSNPAREVPMDAPHPSGTAFNVADANKQLLANDYVRAWNAKNTGAIAEVSANGNPMV